MKRFIEVPKHLIKNNRLPHDAHFMAKETLLEIQTTDSTDSEVKIRCVPEHKGERYPEFINAGFIWPVDILDEFHRFSKNTYLHVGEKIYPPLFVEKHRALFRVRIENKGQYSFSVVDNGCEISSGNVTVL